jgi:crotonobetainyl-CoA:carnitine CoA-transferase CaiB-like acyl-CoA transferase
MSGVAACNARVFGEPKFVPMVMMDHTVGLIATQCILAALFHREKTGEGQAIEVPMFENAASFVLVEHMGDHSFIPPLGDWGDRRVLDPLAQPIATKDGWICVSANTDGQAFALFDAIGRPELKIDPKFNSVKARYANVREYFSIRAEGLKQKTSTEWLDLLEKADVPAGMVHSIDTLPQDEHLADVGLFRKVEHPVEGTKYELNNPNKFSAGLRNEHRRALSRRRQHRNPVRAGLRAGRNRRDGDIEDHHRRAAIGQAVIPGRAGGASPESSQAGTFSGTGFRARSLTRAPRNDTGATTDTAPE